MGYNMYKKKIHRWTEWPRGQSEYKHNNIFNIDDVKPITWNEEAYGHLVYSEEYKDLALALVQNHQRLNKETSDVIARKRHGTVSYY
jgi:hypothetical protein